MIANYAQNIQLLPQNEYCKDKFQSFYTLFSGQT